MPRWYAGLPRSESGLTAGRYLISAYIAYARKWTTARVPPRSSLIIDCGAYSAYLRGLARLPFEPLDYVLFVRNMALRYQVDAVATMDVIGDRDESNYNAARMIDEWPSLPWIATAHGRTPDECAFSAEYLAGLGPAYIGVGCATVVQTEGLAAARARVLAVAAAVPNARLHLWGVGLRAAELLDIPAVFSADSAGWNVTIERDYGGLSRSDFLKERLAQYRAALDS